jgi:hypothetical protein
MLGYPDTEQLETARTFQAELILKLFIIQRVRCRPLAPESGP